MAAVMCNLQCDLKKLVAVQNICHGNFFSQDAGANTVNVTVLDGGQPATISGSVSAKVILPSGTTITVTGGTIADNVASITLPDTVYAEPGMVSVCVKLTDSGVTTTIAAFTVDVYKTSTT